MATIEGLLRAYQDYVRLPWDGTLAGPQRVWLAIYEPAQERRLRLRIEEFASATRAAAHAWVLEDLTDAFARWMAGNEYREAYFEEPETMAYALDEFRASVIERVRATLTGKNSDEHTVVALAGIASLFGLVRTSELLDGVATQVRGRLLVFFPGHRDGSNYRLLDARDGWNYLAIPIEAAEGD